MKLLFSLKETAKAFGVTEKEMLEILGITQAKARDKLQRTIWFERRAKQLAEQKKAATKEEK